MKLLGNPISQPTSVGRSTSQTLSNKLKAIYLDKKDSAKDRPSLQSRIQHAKSSPPSEQVSTVTPIYFKTSTGATVKAHLESSLINSTPSSQQTCIFVLENPNESPPSTKREEPTNVLYNTSPTNKHDNDVILKNTRDVFLPQVVEQESDFETEFANRLLQEEQNLARDESVKQIFIKTDGQEGYAILSVDEPNHQQTGYPSSELGQSYTSDQASSQAMVSSFPYGAGGTGNESMYSQQSNLHTYMDSHGNASQNQMFQSYSAQGGHPGSMGLGVSPQAIGVAQQAQYLQPGQAASQRVPISHTTRASPITVQWLLENYETSDGVSLPRSTLYHHYLRHCAENKIDAVNAASFGKLIRSVFVGLKTRRLGTRGNSKYHYYGIRVKPNSPLARITDDTHVALRATPTSSKRSMGSNNYDEERRTEGAASNAEDSSALSAHQQYLGDVGDGLPEGPVIDLTEPLPEGLKKEDVITFGNYYRSHSEALLEVISTLQFDLVEALWQSFYKSPAAANKADNGTLDNNEFNITKNDLITFCNYKPVQVFIKETDYILYQKLVGVLVPDVLRAVPSALTQIVRNFAKSLENWLVGSMSEMPKEICNVKVAAVSAFSQTLRRYTSLNHLAQAARAVLQNSQQINQMWNDLNKVDFNNVQEQSSWVCQCDESLIAKLEQDFKQTLAQQHSLEQWAKWLESVVAMVLEPHQGQESYPKAARNFLLNWSFYSSMIIRDLTLRSAASFGSFHLIRLLYDEYMFYLIEHKVAAHTGKSPMSVMAECVGGMTSSSNGNQGNDDEDELDENSNDGLSALTGGDVLKAGANLTMSQINEGMEPVAKKLKPDHLG